MQVQTYSSGMGFTSVFGGGAAATTDASGRLPLTVPALSAVVYRAAAALAPSTRNPIVTLTEPAEGAEVVGNVELEAVLDRAQLAEVTFALKAGAATDWTVLGTDDNPPYRIFYDVSGLAAGTPLQIKAIARDRSGNLDSDTATAVVGEVEPPQPGAARDYAVVHYQRPDADYDGWGVHVWGDVNEPDVTWATPKPLAGEDEFGRFAWVKLAPNASQVGFIVHKGDTKDPDGSPDRFFDPQQTPEIWLKSGDATVYASRAAAQGYVELRYHRPDGVYTGWGLHLWGDAIDPTEATEWAAPKLPDRIDDYGAHWLVRIQDATKAGQLHRPQGRREGHGRGPELPAGREAVRLAAVRRLDRLRHARRRRGLRADPLPPRRRRLRRRDLARLQRLLGPARLGRLGGDGRHLAEPGAADRS